MFTVTRSMAAWVCVGIAIGAIAGTGSAALLVILDEATLLRGNNPLAIWMMPAAGALTAWAYRAFGGRAAQGNLAILAEIEKPALRLPVRMAPMVLVGTALAHVTGASVGREGTAVQMVVPIADQLTRAGTWRDADRRVLLTAAIAAGFASVFGTPLAGMMFGLEVRRIGAMRYDALLACLAAAFAADAVTDAWGIQHTRHAIGDIPPLGFMTGAEAAIAGLAFGLAARAFVRSTRCISLHATRWIPSAPVRAAIGGSAVILAVSVLGIDRHLGLSLPLIADAFDGPVAPWDWLAKLVLTAACVATGFRGGEVTPLFVIGATLGNALALALALPVPLLAGMGMVATFAGASNAPLASIIAGIEMFGPTPVAYLAIACVGAYLASGHAGMYPGQAIEQPKYGN